MSGTSCGGDDDDYYHYDDDDDCHYCCYYYYYFAPMVEKHVVLLGLSPPLSKPRFLAVPGRRDDVTRWSTS